MSPIETVNLLAKHMQALHGDTILYFSNEESVSTGSRREMLEYDIASVKKCIDSLERFIVKPNEI